MYAKSRARPAVIVLNAGANAVCWCAASPLTCESRLERAVERGSARAHAPCPALQSARPAARACRPPRPPPPTSAAAQRLSSNCAPQRRSRAPRTDSSAPACGLKSMESSAAAAGTCAAARAGSNGAPDDAAIDNTGTGGSMGHGVSDSGTGRCRRRRLDTPPCFYGFSWWRGMHGMHLVRSSGV